MSINNRLERVEQVAATGELPTMFLWQDDDDILDADGQPVNLAELERTHRLIIFRWEDMPHG